MAREVTIQDVVLAPLRLKLVEAKMTQARINILLRRGHDRAAEALRKLYYFKHGETPAEHAVELRKQIALRADRWSPQP